MIKKIFSIKNVVPTIIVILSFLGIFFKSKLFIDSSDIVLAAISFLAIDALIERIGILNKIGEDVNFLRRRFTHNADSVFKNRKEFPRFEELINKGNKEICISGIALDSVARHVGLLQKRIEEGISFRILILSLSAVNETALFLGEDSKAMKSRLKTNSELLRKIEIDYPQKIKIKELPARQPIGFFIVDPSLSNGFLTLEFYITHVTNTDRPFIYLSKTESAKWFKIFCDHYDDLWNSI